MQITCDPAKDASNIQRRGLSLALAGEIDWGFAYEWQDERMDYGEVRMGPWPPLATDCFALRMLTARQMHPLSGASSV
jgi:hypothetical protein